MKTRMHLLAGCLALMVPLSSLPAATLTVTTSSDQLDVPAGAQLSLREAIRDAATGDTIDFNAGLSGALMVLTKFAFVIDVKDLDIDASALSSGISIEPSSSFPSRHFNISGGTTVTLNNLTLSGGPVLPEEVRSTPAAVPTLACSTVS